MRYEIKSFSVKLKLAETKTEAKALTNPALAISVSKGIFKTLDADQEHFIMLMMNSQNELIGYKHLNSGTIDQVAVYPRIVMRNAILGGAAAIIIVHNHPSGHSDPSEEDKSLTVKISRIGKDLDVKLLDHIILGNDVYYSFREKQTI